MLRSIIKKQLHANKDSIDNTTKIWMDIAIRTVIFVAINDVMSRWEPGDNGDNADPDLSWIHHLIYIPYNAMLGSFYYLKFLIFRILWIALWAVMLALPSQCVLFLIPWTLIYFSYALSNLPDGSVSTVTAVGLRLCLGFSYFHFRFKSNQESEKNIKLSFFPICLIGLFSAWPLPGVWFLFDFVIMLKNDWNNFRSELMSSFAEISKETQASQERMVEYHVRRIFLAYWIFVVIVDWCYQIFLSHVEDPDSVSSDNGLSPMYLAIARQTRGHITLTSIMQIFVIVMPFLVYVMSVILFGRKSEHSAYTPIDSAHYFSGVMICNHHIYFGLGHEDPSLRLQELSYFTVIAFSITLMFFVDKVAIALNNISTSRSNAIDQVKTLGIVILLLTIIYSLLSHPHDYVIFLATISLINLCKSLLLYILDTVDFYITISRREDIICFVYMSSQCALVINSLLKIWSIFAFGFYPIMETINTGSIVIQQVRHQWKTFRIWQNTIQRVGILEEATQEYLRLHDDVCGICLREMKSAKITACGHLMHESCLRRGLYYKNSCPLCRGSVFPQIPHASNCVVIHK